MPRRVVSDENSIAQGRKAKVMRSGAAAFVSDYGSVKKKKSLLGNSQVSGEIRVFGREIKNVVEGHRQDTQVSIDEFQFKIPEPNVSQLTAGLETLNLQGVGATREAINIPMNQSSVFADTSFQPSILFSRQAFSSSSSTTCFKCKGRQIISSGYDSDKASSSHSGAIRCACHRRQYSSNALSYRKLPSFRSASIASQSTPFVKGTRRRIRPFHPADDDSLLLLPAYPESRDTHKEPLEVGLPKGTTGKAGGEATDALDGNDIMTQLASQLSDVVLSPCVESTSYEIMDTPEVRLSRDSILTPARTRLKGRLKNRSASFSLGFIPAAFPDAIDIDDLRIVF